MKQESSIQEQAKVKHRLLPTLYMLAFGLLLLGVLVLFDKGNWWTVKPATGTAAAMSAASNQAPASAKP